MRWVFPLLLSACAAPHAVALQCPANPQPAPMPAPPPPLVTANISRCPHAARAPLVTAPKKDPDCHSLEEDTLNGVERTLRKRFKPTWSTHKLVVDWGCDAASSDVRDIDFEEGSGHGGTLRIFHLERVPGEPAKYEVRALSFSSYYNTGTTFAETQIDGKKLEASLGAVRLAMLAKMHDVSLYRENGSLGGFGFGSSSNDFHLRIRLGDKEGNAIDRGYSGYSGSYEQEDRIPVELAAEPFQAALKGVAFSPGVPTQADRELFVRHFLMTFEKGQPFWWVGERMFELAPELGSSEIVPAIVDWLAHTDAKTTARIRETAVRALAEITGLDLRKTESGGERPLEEVIADYVRECG